MIFQESPTLICACTLSEDKSIAFVELVINLYVGVLFPFSKRARIFKSYKENFSGEKTYQKAIHQLFKKTLLFVIALLIINALTCEVLSFLCYV